MTPQCAPVLHCAKRPLLERGAPALAVRRPDKQQEPPAPLPAPTPPPPAKERRRDRIKCVLVGDQAVGKTSLAVSYSNDSFPSEYVPTAYDNYKVEVEVDGKPVRVELCDTAGEDELNPLRHLCYPGADVFMLCFSIVKPESFFSACTRWADEITRQDAAVVLVGTQADLANNLEVLNRLRARGQRPVSPSEARGLAERLNAPYVETSAKTCNRLKEAFDQAITIALRMQRRKRKWWKKLWCVGSS